MRLTDDGEFKADAICKVLRPFRRAGIAVAGSQTPPVTQHPILLRITQLPVGRRASGFVLVAQCLVIRRATRIYVELRTSLRYGRLCFHRSRDWDRRSCRRSEEASKAQSRWVMPNIRANTPRPQSEFL